MGLLLAVCAGIGALPAYANDSTIPCNSPPDKGASVAVHPATQVSTTQDQYEKTCVFSINGAVATSPPQAEVIRGLNTFVDPTRPYLVDKGLAVSALAALLAAPAPVDRVPSDLVDVLTRFSAPLTQCLGWFSTSTFKAETIGEGPFRCRGIAPYTSAEQKAQMLRTTGTAVAVPTLAISVVWGDGRFTSVTYLPLAIIGAPPLRPQ